MEERPSAKGKVVGSSPIEEYTQAIAAYEKALNADQALSELSSAEIRIVIGSISSRIIFSDPSRGLKLKPIKSACSKNLLR